MTSSSPIGDCGTWLLLKGTDTLYGPFLSTAADFTPVSQALTGAGTAADPFRIVTVVDAGTSGVRLTQTDSYVVGEVSWRTDVQITNNSGAPQEVRLYRAADCFLGGSDRGFGQLGPQPGAVACRSELGRLLQWVPLTPGSNFNESRTATTSTSSATTSPSPTCAPAKRRTTYGELRRSRHLHHQRQPAGNASFDPAPQVTQTITVVKASPTIATQASAGNLVGAPVRDVATVSGGFNPTGTVTFRLFSDANCNTQVFTSTNPLGSPSDWFTPATAGTYRWVATYNGDANNNTVSGACNDPNESVTLAPFVAPAYTRIIEGDHLGPVTVTTGESVLIRANARVVGPVTVAPGGALTVENAKITRGVTADNPSFLSICGTEISPPSTGAQALGVSNATVPIRIGDPATGCAGNRFAGQVNLTANLATTFGANQVSHATTVTNGGIGATVIKANTFFASLACTGNTPAPVNAGQPNTAPSKAGQCMGL